MSPNAKCNCIRNGTLTFGQRRQLDKPPAVIKLGTESPGDLQSEDGLADAAGTGHRHDAIGGDQIA